jgi:hypothetical protein
MAELRDLARQISASLTAFSKKHFAASMFVKVVLVIGGATIAAVAQCIELAHSNDEFSAWTMAGLAGAVVVAVGGIFVAITETDISTILEVSGQTIEEARLRERRIELFNADRARLKKEIDRGLELYNSIDVMRGAIEQSLDVPGVTAKGIIQTSLISARNSLLVAFDFSIEDTWTICVFMAMPQKESDKVILKCIAQARKIECGIEVARQWPEGVGVAGVAYSMGNDITIPDVLAPELGTVFNLGSNVRDYDNKRYRSMVAVPIRPGDRKIPWGVAVVTTDKAKHFNLHPSDGVSTSEPIRAIAAMAALAVQAVERIEPPPGGPRPTGEPDRLPSKEPEGIKAI